MPPIVSITFCICLSVTGGRLPAPTNIIINSPTCQAELVMRADDIRDQSHSAPGWMRGEKAVSNVCQTSLSLTISHWNLVFHCYYRHRRDPLCVSVCLFVFSVLIIQSGQPVIISLLEGPTTPSATCSLLSVLSSHFITTSPGRGLAGGPAGSTLSRCKTETLFGQNTTCQMGRLSLATIWGF